MARRMSVARLLGLASSLALGAIEARAQEQIGTLVLDSGAYVSYGESATVQIPAGSSIRFRFGSTNPDGSIAITVQPGDLTVAPIPVGEGNTVEYSLGGTATGTLRRVSGTRHIELFATLVAALRESAEVPPVAYQLRFTTGVARASNTSQTESVTVEGAPATTFAHVELVGAATNRPDAFPGPGEAVYAVLSGSFDWLPAGE